jgi:hypothetical protein
MASLLLIIWEAQNRGQKETQISSPYMVKIFYTCKAIQFGLAQFDNNGFGHNDAMLYPNMKVGIS